MVRLATKAILMLTAVGCALATYRFAEVAALRGNAPLEETQIAPHDAKALANALGSRFDSSPEYKPSARDMADVYSALARQPLEPKLLGILGLAYEASGDAKRAAETMRIANRASRRDSVSGLYLIESTSASGDVNATLRHYNAVLSTRPELNAALLPILSSAIAYPEIRAELRRYLQIPGKWVPAFLDVAAAKGNLTDLQALLLPLPKALLADEYALILANVLHRIAVEEGRASALRFAEATIPTLSPTSFANMNLDATTRDKRLGLFAWTFPDNDGLQVEVGEDKSLRIYADPLARGIVATRDFLLDAGRKYQLVEHLDYGPGLGRVDVRWAADCITPAGTAPFWQKRLTASGSAGGYRSELIVPEDCSVVRMNLHIEGPDGQMPETLSISGLLLSRAN